MDENLGQHFNQDPDQNPDEELVGDGCGPPDPGGTGRTLTVEVTDGATAGD